MGPLPDGTYDVFIVEAEEASGGTTRLDLTITSGPQKGEVVTVRASGMNRDPISLLGSPATLTVAEGVPRVALDD
ncbi:MAG: hypothetical protein QOG64_1745 [Acidimicrobiaceae bacterium]|jgi:hypothetical protein|nr:hypothetical protein [Acidimicrobiaceae bacterium]